MGELLTDVMSTNDKGLIGFTKIGEEVKSGVPKPNFFEYKLVVGGT